jgi:hypothetical protein
MTETTGYWKISVTPMATVGTFTNGMGVTMSFARAGDKGSAADIAAEVTAAGENLGLALSDLIAVISGGVLKKITWANVLASIKSYYDSVAATLTNKSIDASTNTLTNVNTSALANDAVSNAKLANMASSTIKGRVTAGTGDPEDLTPTQLIALIESFALYALLAGRLGGQTLYGGTGSGDVLRLSGSSNATKGGVRVPDDKMMVGADVAPDTTFEVVDTGTATTRGFVTGQHNSGAQAALFIFRKSRGSRSSPSAVTLNDNIGAFYGQGYDGSAYLQTVGIGYKITGAVSAGSIPTDILFGAGDFDSANFTNEKMRLTSTGQLLIGVSSGNASKLGVEAGQSNNDASVGGVLYTTTTQVGNVGTGEDDLASYSVPANTLSTNGMSLWFEAALTITSSANNKRVRIRFGTTGTNLLYDSGTLVTGTIVIRGRIIRTGATSQKGYAIYASAAGAQLVTNLNQTLSGAVTLKITGEAVANNEVLLESFVVGWDDANS